MAIASPSTSLPLNESSSIPLAFWAVIIAVICFLTAAAFLALRFFFFRRVSGNSEGGVREVGVVVFVLGGVIVVLEVLRLLLLIFVSTTVTGSGTSALNVFVTLTKSASLLSKGTGRRGRLWIATKPSASSRQKTVFSRLASPTLFFGRAPLLGH